MIDTTKRPTLAVIIPTLNAEGEIGFLLDSISRQNVVPDEVVVVDSASDDSTCDEVASRVGVRLIRIERKQFNHGLTRDMALKETRSEFVCFMTQDASPADDRLFANLLAPMLEDSSVALVTARQLPKPDARRYEQLVREFNYPARRIARGLEDVSRYGIKAFFASDVCSLYRRTAYLACGGFQRVITYEDMIMAAALIGTGYKVIYEPSACVYHSHNLSPCEQYARNKDGGMCIEEHREDLLGASEIGEGGKLVKYVASRLLKEGRVGELWAFGIDCVARFVGNRMGHRLAKQRREVI